MVAEEIKQVAEADENVVVVPVVLEAVEVPVEAPVRVHVQVRNAVVTVENTKS